MELEWNGYWWESSNDDFRLTESSMYTMSDRPKRSLVFNETISYIPQKRMSHIRLKSLFSLSSISWEVEDGA